MKLKEDKNNIRKGFTLIELIVSLAIFLLVLGLGYNFYFYLNKSYKSTETKWISQREVRKASDFINSELKNAYSLTISNNSNPAGADGICYVYLKDGDILFKDGANPSVTIAEGGLQLQFRKGKNKDGVEMNNVLAYQVSSTAIKYDVDSSVILSNMGEGQSITGSGIGTSIEFKTASDITSIPSTELGSFCFIATAAYGSNTQPSVMLLRRFRDDVLLKSEPGTRFVEFYYKNSPPVAEKIAGSKMLKYVALLLMMPVVGIVAAIMYKEIMLLLMLFVLLKAYFARKHDTGISIYPHSNSYWQ